MYLSQRIEAGSDKMDGSDLIIVQPEKKKKKKRSGTKSATKRTSKSATRRWGRRRCEKMCQNKKKWLKPNFVSWYVLKIDENEMRFDLAWCDVDLCFGLRCQVVSQCPPWYPGGPLWSLGLLEDILLLFRSIPTKESTARFLKHQGKGTNFGAIPTLQRNILREGHNAWPSLPRWHCDGARWSANPWGGW